MSDGGETRAAAGRRTDWRRTLSAAITAIVLLASVAPLATAQEAEETRTVTAATRDYRVSGFNRWLRGADYRELWATPVEAPLLDLEGHGNGLDPRFALGEGRGLAMRGEDGRSYTFRALDKDLARTLPESWYYTLPADLLQDQTVADHPAANLIVPRLAAAAGILRPATRLVVMPDSARLGEFRSQFAGVLGTIEEYPTSAAGFHGADEIIDTETLWERTREGRARPDARALLRVRLLDMLVGDWDRHHEQFRWARIPGQPRWQPLPEDHDHAFVSYEGVALTLARTRAPRLVTFTDRISQLDGLNEKGLEVDSWILSELTLDEFTRAAAELVRTLPDEEIERAVRSMPAEYHSRSADPLTRRLIARRDDLPRAAREFYLDLAGHVDVWATHSDDRVEVTHGGLHSRVLVRNAGGDRTWFDRTFAAPETARVRIHLGAGADELVILGHGGVPIAAVAGPGPDRIEARSETTELFDLGPEDHVEPVRGVRIHRSENQAEDVPTSPPWVVPRDRGSSVYPVLWGSMEPDASVFIGGGMVWQHHGLRAYPWAERHRMRFGFGFGRAIPRFEYDATFRPPQSRLAYRLAINANGFARLNYYGFGNETTGEEPSDDFFEANGREVLLRGAVERQLGAAGIASFGITVSRFNDSRDEGSLLTLEQPYGSGGFSSTYLTAGWQRDTRRPTETEGEEWRIRGDLAGIPFRGSDTRLRIEVRPALLDVESWFAAIEGSATRYLPVGRRLTIAARVGGRHVRGEYPWQSAAFIGGAGSVRGYKPQRFAGRSSLYGNLEARVDLGRTVLLMPGELGVFVHGDVGRVWVDGDESERWHPAIGGGFYFVQPDTESVFHAGIAAGTEGPLVHLGFGFPF